MLKLRYQLTPTNSGHPHVEQNDVRRIVLDSLQSFGSILCELNRYVRSSERLGDLLPQRILSLDEKGSRRSRHSHLQGCLHIDSTLLRSYM